MNQIRRTDFSQPALRFGTRLIGVATRKVYARVCNGTPETRNTQATQRREKVGFGRTGEWGGRRRGEAEATAVGGPSMRYGPIAIRSFILAWPPSSWVCHVGTILRNVLHRKVNEPAFLCLMPREQFLLRFPPSLPYIPPSFPLSYRVLGYFNWRVEQQTDDALIPRSQTSGSSHRETSRKCCVLR